jgi:membrane associated rhomboid family serine protease
MATMTFNCANCGAPQTDPKADFCTACGKRLTFCQGEQPQQGGNKCEFCANVVPYSEFFRCKYCGGGFCYDHRLPENHLCKSTSARRVIPTGESSSGAGSYSFSSSPRYGVSRRSTSGFGFNISPQGKNLIIAILAGLGIGSVLSFIYVSGFELVLFFLEVNALVYQGWVWQLFTAMIISPFGIAGFLDVAFNAFALLWLDRIFSSVFTPREYYLTFIATGVFGNALSLLYGPHTISFGASGGIFGLIAGVVTADYAINRKFNASLVMWFIFIFALSSFTGGVDIFAHLGGALLGLPIGYWIGKKHSY